VVVVVSLLLGKNPLDVLALLSGGSAPTTSSVPRTAPAGNDSQTDFVRAILGSTEDTWGEMFSAAGKQYPAPKLVLFHGQTQSGCGRAAAAMGPFYCPQDREVYLDLDFFQEMETRFHAAGDLARAYVIAHEVGHHVQNLLGRMRSVDEARERGAPMEGANGLSVRLELQADCYAGVWANRAQQRLQWLQAGDVEGALAAATAIGDDALQKQSRGAIVPDAFTHGTSAMRVHWFRAGMESGEIKSCDTFRTAQL
jgi:predicted metalloprotease